MKDYIYISDLSRVYSPEDIIDIFREHLMLNPDAEIKLYEFNDMEFDDQMSYALTYFLEEVAPEIYQVFLEQLQATSELTGKVVCSVDKVNYDYHFNSLLDLYNELIAPYIKDVPLGLDVYFDEHGLFTFHFEEFDKPLKIYVKDYYGQDIKWVDEDIGGLRLYA
jgi:hypothetical protein